jgi:chemotaxis protein CheX
MIALPPTPSREMPTTTPISDEQIQTNIVRAVHDVFHTMLSRPAVLVEPGAASEPPAAPETTPAVPQLVGSVSFLGEANGALYLCFQVSSARQFMGSMLGVTAAELAAMGEEPVNDAVGELTNMVAGSFKNALCDAGRPCKLTLPSILRGSNFCVQLWPPNSIRRHTFTFRSHDHRIVAEILMKIED